MYCAMTPAYGLATAFLRDEGIRSGHGADLQRGVVRLPLPGDESVRCQHRDAATVRPVGDPVLLDLPLPTVRPPPEQRDDERPRTGGLDLAPEGLVGHRPRLDERRTLTDQYRSLWGHLQ